MFLGVFGIGSVMENKVFTLLPQIICGMVIYGGICVIYFISTKDAMFLKMLDNIKKKVFWGQKS